jgi:hypothetical protein
MSWTNMESILMLSLLPLLLPSVTELSCMTKLSEDTLVVENLSYLPMNKHSDLSTMLSSSQEELNSLVSPRRESPQEELPLLMKSATISMINPVAATHLANITTSASSVESPDMAEPCVLREMEHIKIKPKYLCFNCWADDDIPCYCVVDWSIDTKDLPSAPVLPAAHPLAKTIASHPDLF